ncbi:MAG: aminotransferase class V-fold PLP-dependent enzyme [Ignavibacteriales bacterium]|nr:aminotransferase class V-fold PLP-dependent enzyme [Ignavibacteriales bacterium]
MPEPVLKAQEQLWALPGVGMSILEISHRSKTFDKIIAEAKDGLKSLLSISDDYTLLFLQGGASLQFSMVPMNLMVKNKKGGLHSNRKLVEESS